MNPVKRADHKLEHDDTIIDYFHQSSIPPRKDTDEKMESSAKSAPKEIATPISEVQPSSAKSQAEPSSGDASLSSSIASLLSVSDTESHLETEDRTKITSYSTSISVRESQGPPFGARNIALDPTKPIHFDRLKPEIQSRIIKECIPERDQCRLFSVSLDHNYQMLLKDVLDMGHTSILFVSRAFRKLYLYHLPIVLPSLDKNKPICIHQDTTVILDVEELDPSNIRMCYRARIPTCFSEIEHLAVPLHLFSLLKITAGVALHGEVIQELAVAHNISFLSKLIFACSNLRSLTAIQHDTTGAAALRGLNSKASHIVPKVFSFLLKWNIDSLANFLNLQRAMTGYRNEEIEYHVEVFTLANSVNKGLNINYTDKKTGPVYFQVNKANATKIAHLDIESFIDKYCYSPPRLAKVPQNYLGESGRKLIRAVLSRMVTGWLDEYFNSSTNIEDAKNGKEILELMEDGFEQFKKFNPDDGESIEVSMPYRSRIIES
ncbi:hypothetical protein EAE96_006957 [Botrytis aclada]|nr:hypothetical protein EAE96_006957 [Botrytis aclada]